MPRKAKISREEVLAAALRVADAVGVDGLTMRKVGEELGVEAMSLYNHVPNKAAVLDGIHETVLTEMVVGQATGDWKSDAKAMALAFWDSLVRHPRVLVLFATRPAITRGSLRYVERGLSVLGEPFPEMQQRVCAFQSLVTFVVGHAMASVAEPAADLDYASLPHADYPILRTCPEALRDISAREEVEFGLDAMIEGLALRQAKSWAGKS